ncbi:coiled-coil domain-containing protein 97 [Gastrophryne carolinensis]
MEEKEDEANEESGGGRDCSPSPAEENSEEPQCGEKRLQQEEEEEASMGSMEASLVLAKALKEERRLGSREEPIPAQDPPDVSGAVLEMFTAVCQSRVPIRSQQKGEPEFSREQKMSLLLDLYRSKPLIFLERFHKVLKEEHLPCFSYLSGDYTANFYFKEIRKTSLKKVTHTRVRNKRYAALQQLISAGEYFSDEQMRQRDPLMYEHYVGQYQSEEEIMSQNRQDMSQANSLSDVLLNSCQEQALQRRLEIQRELEDNCIEEEEDDSTDQEESELSEDEQMPDSEERALMREEFISRMHQRFLDGEDIHFDYSEVDDNPDFDNLDIVNRDEEEKYFDDDGGDDDDMETLEAAEGRRGKAKQSENME